MNLENTSKTQKNILARIEMNPDLDKLTDREQEQFYKYARRVNRRMNRILAKERQEYELKTDKDCRTGR